MTYIVQSAAFTRVLDGNPDIDLLLYSEFLSRYGMSRFSIEWVYQQPLDFTRAATLYHFDMNQVCTTKEAFEAAHREGPLEPGADSRSTASGQWCTSPTRSGRSPRRWRRVRTRC